MSQFTRTAEYRYFWEIRMGPASWRPLYDLIDPHQIRKEAFDV